MSRLDKIYELRSSIDKVLLPIVKGKKVHLCGLSGRQNAGDGLIALGELDFLRSKDIDYTASYIFDEPRLKPEDTEDIIMFSGGGGNFSIWINVFSEYIHVASKFPGNKIVFLPYSESFEVDDKYLSMIDGGRFVHLCRDSVTYELAKKRLPNSTVLLCPDMAFYADLHKFTEDNIDKSIFTTMIMERNDVEKVAHDIPIIPSSIVEDWVTMPYEYRQKKHPYGIQTTYNLLANRVVKQFLQYEKIISTRLHGVILAYLLGLEVEYIDNSYGKIGNLIRTYNLDIKEYEDKSYN